ncbi:lipoprotein [Pseudomaricurvus sp. HS19]|nr:lipoprotein [Pseudomaricurvus sp. HS19]MYM63862.1 hypothetical protein [Pseudomaricurvus sp. HS19]
MRHTLLILAAISCLLGLAGCGQKGPLYLPQPSEQAPATQPSGD